MSVSFRLYVISDRRRMGPDPRAGLHALLAAGLPAFQWREKDLTPAENLERLRALAEVAGRFSARHAAPGGSTRATFEAGTSASAGAGGPADLLVGAAETASAHRSGPPGSNRPSGPPGSPGSTGSTGPSGSPGSPGSTGSSGSTGPSGSPGSTGPSVSTGTGPASGASADAPQYPWQFGQPPKPAPPVEEAVVHAWQQPSSLVGETPVRPNADVHLFINDRIDLALAARCHLHLTEMSIPTGTARALLPAGTLLGRSTHSVERALAAEAEGADFVTFGPVYDTPSKRAYGPPLGLEALRAACGRLRIPVFALGGVSLDRIRECRAAGAWGVAMIGAVWEAPDPAEAVRQALSLVE